MSSSDEYAGTPINPAIRRRVYHRIILKGPPDEREDYRIYVSLPNGGEITVLIPAGDKSTYPVQSGFEYGLNLVTHGHYT